jgi:hypothetical protein
MTAGPPVAVRPTVSRTRSMSTALAPQWLYSSTISGCRGSRPRGSSLRGVPLTLDSLLRARGVEDQRIQSAETLIRCEPDKPAFDFDARDRCHLSSSLMILDWSLSAANLKERFVVDRFVAGLAPKGVQGTTLQTCASYARSPLRLPQRQGFRSRCPPRQNKVRHGKRTVSS